MLSTQRINNVQVRPIPLPPGAEDKRPVLGSKLVTDCYANIFLCAPKKSGKTTVLYNLLMRCAGLDTTVIAFASTLDKDPGWISISDQLEDRGIAFVGHTSLREDGVDLLKELVDELQAEAKAQREAAAAAETTEEAPKPVSCISCDEPEEEETEGKPRKRRFRAPEYIIVLDDLSNELKSPTLTALLKMNRHFRCKTIISSQWVHDMDPQSLKQIDLWILFKGLIPKKVEKVHKDADLAVPLTAFARLYADATRQRYGFLYVDARNEDYRRGFSERYVTGTD